jgi:hypothetical protein
MSVLFLTGWEHGGADIVPVVGSPVASTDVARTGSYSYKCTKDDGALLSLLGDYADDGIHVGVAIYLTAAGVGGLATPIISCVGSSLIQCGVGISPSSTTLCLFRDSPSGPVILATGSTLQLNTWYYLNLFATVGNDDEISGVMYLYVNGILDAQYSGDTQREVSPSLGRIGINYCGVNGALSGAAAYYDDLVIGTSAVGQCRIELLKPEGAGNSTQLSKIGATNWGDVADVPADDDDSYVYESTADLKDTYDLTDSTLAGTVKAVQWFVRARAEGEGATGYIKRVFRLGGTDYAGSALGVDGVYRYVREVVEANPADSQAWETSDLDAMEAGVQIV